MLLTELIKNKKLPPEIESGNIEYKLKLIYSKDKIDEFIAEIAKYEAIIF